MCTVPENFVFQKKQQHRRRRLNAGARTHTHIQNKNQQINGFNFIIFRYLDCFFFHISCAVVIVHLWVLLFLLLAIKIKWSGLECK